MARRNVSYPFLKINGRRIGLSYPTYFIADIAANHDGSLKRAKRLMRLAKEAGADAAKFQHFIAEKIVSDYGFKSMRGQISHQAKWKKTVFQIYQDASVPWKWTSQLAAYAKKIQIDFFSAPYDLNTIDMLDQYLPAYKIGSGDIDWTEALQRIAAKQKPILLATGASTLSDVERAVTTILKINHRLCLMQCNTNYTASLENFKSINLNVLKTYAKKYPQVVLGLSDHTPGHATVLGAITLGARMIEKHFTDDRHREGPDHVFSMDPVDWREMVDRARELERALGDGLKRVESNESETSLIQRRCCRASRNLIPGHVLSRSDIDVLRPFKVGAFRPFELHKLLGKRVIRTVPQGEALQPFMITP